MYFGFDSTEDMELALISIGQPIPDTCFYGHVNAKSWGPRFLVIFAMIWPMMIFVVANLLRYFIMKKVAAPIAQNVSPQTKQLQEQCSKVKMAIVYMANVKFLLNVIISGINVPGVFPVISSVFDGN